MSFGRHVLETYKTQKREHSAMIKDIPRDRWWFGDWKETRQQWVLYRKGSSDRLEAMFNNSGTFRRPREARYLMHAGGLRPMTITLVPEDDSIKLDVVLDIYSYARALDYIYALRERIGLERVML